MIRYILSVCSAVLCSSCASLLHSDTTRITFHRATTATEVAVNDTTFIVESRASIRVPRSKDSIQIRLKSDAQDKTLVLPAKRSPLYYYNVFNMGLGFIWDDPSLRSYEYSSWIDLSDEAQPVKKRDFYSGVKGTWKFGFSVPYVNTFYFQPDGQASEADGGFFGLSLLTEYYYKDKRYLALNAGAAVDVPVPVPASVSYDGSYTSLGSLFISLTDNHEWDRFTLGYGLNYATNIWSFNADNSLPEGPIVEDVTEQSSGFGLAINSYYRFGKNFYVGLVYRPTILKIHPTTTFEYEHSISLDLVWKWRISKPPSP